MTYMDRARRKRLDIGSVFERAVAAVGAQGLGLLATALVVVGLPQAILNWGQMNIATTTGSGLEAGLAMTGGWLLTIVGGVIMQGVVTDVVIADLQRRKPTIGAALGTAGGVFAALLGLSIVSGLGMMIGLILLIVPGVILALIWSVAAPVVVAEKKGVFDALSRSRTLTRDNRLMILLLFVIAFVANLVLGALIGLLVGSLGGLVGAMQWATIAITAITSTLGAIIWGAIAAALYVELRIIKEGGGHESIASVFD